MHAMLRSDATILTSLAGHPLGSSWSPVVVDFCSGGGHLGILVAHLLPAATVCLVENKEESLRRAVERVEALGKIKWVIYRDDSDKQGGGLAQPGRLVVEESKTFKSAAFLWNFKI